MNGKAAIFSEDGGLITHRRCRLNKRFGNRLAEGITIGCSSLSTAVPADEQISAFYIYLQP